jgi:hypothetical protein
MDMTKQAINSISTTGFSMGSANDRFRRNPYEMDLGGDKEDIRWLI